MELRKTPPELIERKLWKNSGLACPTTPPLSYDWLHPLQPAPPALRQWLAGLGTAEQVHFVIAACVAPSTKRTMRTQVGTSAHHELLEALRSVV